MNQARILSKHVSRSHLLTSFSTQLPAYLTEDLITFQLTTKVAFPVNLPQNDVAFQKAFGIQDGYLYLEK